MTYKIKRKNKKSKYHYIILDSGKRKRFKKGEHPSYEYAEENEKEYF
jgi:hypothetical protein